MTTQTPTPRTPYTPTHVKGVKLSKAARRAANKAKWAAEQASKPKPKRKAGKAGKRKAVAKAVSIPTANGVVTGYVASPPVKAAKLKVADVKAWLSANPKRKTLTPAEVAGCASAPSASSADEPAAAPAEGEGEPAPASPVTLDDFVPLSDTAKRLRWKSGQTRKPSNTRMEARAQRESLRKQEARRVKENETNRKVVHADTGKEAQPFEPRKEVLTDVAAARQWAYLEEVSFGCDDICMDDVSYPASTHADVLTSPCGRNSSPFGGESASINCKTMSIHTLPLAQPKADLFLEINDPTLAQLAQYDFDYIDACSRTYEPILEPTPAEVLLSNPLKSAQ